MELPGRAARDKMCTNILDDFELVRLLRATINLCFIFPTSSKCAIISLKQYTQF